MDGDFVRGGFTGTVHALSAADHLCALLPACVGQSFDRAARIGLLWGVGHGFGAIVIGAFGLLLRNFVDVAKYSHYLELAVGVTLIIIGLSGISESLKVLGHDRRAHGHDHHDHCLDQALHRWACFAWFASRSNGAASASRKDGLLSAKAALMTGVLHGVSGSGHAVGVMPAIMLPTAARCAAYLLGFSVCTGMAMSAFTGGVGVATRLWAAAGAAEGAAAEDEEDRRGAEDDRGKDRRGKHGAIERRLGYFSLGAGSLSLATGVFFILTWQ